jgi:hypothetical protein
MTLETFSTILEENRNFVAACKICAHTPSAHQFANKEASNDAYEAKKTFLEAITSDPTVLKERAADLKLLQEEQKEAQIAFEVELEQSAKAAERIKFNRIVEETANK